MTARNLTLYLALAIATFGSGLSSCKTDAAEETSTTSEASDTAADANSTGPITQSAPTTATDMPAIDAVTGYIDPVCQMKIAETSTERHTHEGVTYGFCSASCRERFAADPAPYLAALEE